MKALFRISAAVEALAGLGLLLAPATSLTLVVGAPVDTPAGVVVLRLMGMALVALALACGRASLDTGSVAASGVIAAMLVYNAAAVGILAHGSLVAGVSGILLWPGVALHLVLAAWCGACLFGRRAEGPQP